VAEHGSLAAPRVEELGELALIPGAVDPHVHVDEPGRTDWEGFACATRAAATGGITTIADMPLNSTPVTTTVEALEAKRGAARGQCVIDVAFHGGLVPANARDTERFEALLRSGIVGVKAFLCDSGLSEFPPVSNQDLAAAMPIVAVAGLPLLVHAERELAAERPARLPSPRYADYLSSRPAAMERAAIDELIGLVRATGCRVHVVHLAAAETVAALRAARDEGLPITVETCPHYLTFCAEDVADGDTLLQCAPPIREAANREGLWRAIEDGTIDLVASDHSPCPPELKATPGRPGRFGEAWGGISSLQLAVAATWTGLRARGHGLERLVELTAARPAALLGLERKGRIAPGADADLVAFDAEAQQVVDARRLHHRHPSTPYHGGRLFGVARRTWLRGELVQAEGEILGEPSGRLLAREGAR
ncbi:MAG TPA: allantoinase AllB, partial [Thermoanaerobaculia bacterium]|nr:allantoinase AllB [Thermoanaerobaculia bacterium]